MKHLFIFFIVIGFTSLVKAQNLVPNPSFEKVKRITSNWSRASAEFSGLVKEWDSPTLGSPDILFEGSRGKMYPKRPKIDLTKYTPRTGKFMTGIKTYGCTGIAMHCREYMQVKLLEPLKKGEQYYIEFWLNPVEYSVKVNSFGIGLSVEKVKEDHDGLISIKPVFWNDKVVNGEAVDEWHRVSWSFESKDDYNYLILGNYSSDESIEFVKEKDGLYYGFYLVDDVLLKHVPRDGEVPFLKKEITSIEDEIIVLDNILFEFDKSELRVSFIPELTDLVKHLKTHSDLEIEVAGHTDSKGGKEYNLELSEQRAITIERYLVGKGIDSSRIHTHGLGSDFPISNDNSEASRKVNRRVEVKIIRN